MKLPNLQRIVAMREPTLGRPTPATGTAVERPPGAVYRAYQRGRLRVIASDDQMDDGAWWLHVSVSTQLRVPTYEELCRVKADFIGRQNEALMLFAKEADHVNLHEYCLHLWSQLS